MEFTSRYLFASANEFDKDKKFLKANDVSFANIYNDLNNSYHVYDNETLSGISIPKKQKS